MGIQSDAAGFWRVIGEAVDNQGFLNDVKRQPKESIEDWRKRLEALPDIKLNTEDLDALVREYDSKTILDLIDECKSKWSPIEASYRT